MPHDIEWNMIFFFLCVDSKIVNNDDVNRFLATFKEESNL